MKSPSSSSSFVESNQYCTVTCLKLLSRIIMSLELLLLRSRKYFMKAFNKHFSNNLHRSSCALQVMWTIIPTARAGFEYGNNFYELRNHLRARTRTTRSCLPLVSWRLLACFSDSHPTNCGDRYSQTPWSPTRRGNPVRPLPILRRWNRLQSNIRGIIHLCPLLLGLVTRPIHARSVKLNIVAVGHFLYASLKHIKNCFH